MGIPADSSDSDTIVTNRANKPRHHGTVTIIIHRVAIPGEEIPAQIIVYIAIVVVVDSIRKSQAFSVIETEIGEKIGVLEIKTAINDADFYATATSSIWPGEWGINIAIRLTPILRPIVQGSPAMQNMDRLDKQSVTHRQSPARKII